MKGVVYIAMVGLIMSLVACFQQSGRVDEEVYGVNGVSLVSPHFQPDSSMMAGVSRIGAGWVAIIPYAFSKQGEPEVYFDMKRQWWGERLEGASELVRLAQLNQLKVMIKPHVWLRNEWIGDFQLDTEDLWEQWEQQYTEYIVAYAKLADSLGVEMFCIGTECKQSVRSRPRYWRRLIGEVKSVYRGKLTYAANWDNFKSVSFWDELDCIGIDAYFPLVHEEDPSVLDLMEAWRPEKDQIASFSRRQNKPVLFTEYGYQSVDGAAGNHWEVIKSPEHFNEKLQSRCYEALYRSFWLEPWFCGGFLWKWHFNESELGASNVDFTPQGKQVEEVISTWYDPSAEH